VPVPRSRLLRASVLATGTVVSIGPVTYPALLALATRTRPDPTPPTPEEWPPLSCVVAAFQEASVIEAKVEGLLDNGYPGPVQVVVVAEDDATADAARRTAATVVQPEGRQGKSAALGLGVAAATGEVVVLSDANTQLAPGSLTALARWFSDPTIGGVGGEKRVEGESEGAYWAFESWLKRRENRLGGSVAMVGEVGAVRRALWRDVPADVAVDDLWIALDVVEQGSRVVYEPTAVAFEAGSETVQEDWERRTRIVAGAVDVLWRRRALLARHGHVSAQLWGHKLVRSALAPPAHVLLAGAVAVASRRSPLARVALAGHVVAIGAAAAQARGRTLPAPLRPVAQLVLLQAVGLGGLARLLRGERLGLWPKIDRS
jgi:cellulose synthase/poly-beta-1,6-N-acetylglucosamine synthase-like glycosyltransferase